MPDIEFKLSANTREGIAAIEKIASALKGIGKTAEESVKKASGEWTKFQGILNSTKQIVAGLGLAFGALEFARAIRGGIQAGMDFNKEWTKLTVILRKTPQNILAQLQSEILALPPALGTAADNVAGLYQIISSGVSDPEKAMVLLKNSAITAAGGFTTTETAVRSGVAVLNAYGIEVENSRRIFDVMAKTVDLGVVSFEELATQLGSVLGVAAANNVSFETLTATVAALTLTGSSAAESVTGVRSILISLISPSEEAKETAKKLGIQWDHNALQTKGLDGILKQLAGNTKVTAADIATLGGRVEAINSIMKLTSATGIKALENSLEGVKSASEGAGAAMDSFKKAQESLSGQTRQLKNEISNLAVEGFIKLEPVISGMVFQVRNLLNVFRTGVVPVNSFTFALGTFGIALIGLKIAAVIGNLGRLKAAFQALSILGAVRGFGDARVALQLLAAQAGLTTTALGTLGSAAVTAGAAFVGWQIGKLIGELTGLDKALAPVFTRLGFFQGRVEQANFSLIRTTTAAAKVMKDQYGVSIQRGTKSLEQWNLEVTTALQKARETDPAFSGAAEAVRNNANAFEEAAQAAKKAAEQLEKLKKLSEGVKAVSVPGLGLPKETGEGTFRSPGSLLRAGETVAPIPAPSDAKLFLESLDIESALLQFEPPPFLQTLPEQFNSIGLSIESASLKVTGFQHAIFTLSASLSNTIEPMKTQLMDLKSTLFGFADALRSTFQSAILGSGSLGAALKKAAAQTVAAKSAEALVLALFETGKAFASLAVGDFRGAALHFKSAAIFGSIGIIGAGIGKALSGGGAGGPERGGALNPVFTRPIAQMPISAVNPGQGLATTTATATGTMSAQGGMLARAVSVLEGLQAASAQQVLILGRNQAGGFAPLMTSRDKQTITKTVFNASPA